MEDLLEPRKTGCLLVGHALVGNVFGCAALDGGGLRCRERANGSGTDVVDRGDAICLAHYAVAVVRKDDGLSGG